MSTSRVFASLLAEKREQIVARFVLETQRSDLAPQGVPRSLLVDHIPRFLDELTSELADATGGTRISEDALSTNQTAREHGEQRWRLGYDLEALIREYGVLRQCILHEAKDARVQLTVDEVEVFSKCMSVGVAEAVTEYVKYRDEQMNAEKMHLAFLSEAGQLLSSSLDYRSTLHRLTALLVPRMADWCAIHIDGVSSEDMPLAHVDPAKLETLRELYRRFPSESSNQGATQVMKTSEPLLMSEVDPNLLEKVAQSAEHLELLRIVHTSSWMIVPLVIQDRTFGALTLGFSESQRRYEKRDLVIASDLAQRAAVAIDNARLYDLSQSERSRVEAATRAKDEFVAMVSHELRTPLNAILGWLGLMRAGTLTQEKRDHAFEVIERNANAQSRLVGDLLDISRMLNGTIRISPSQMDLGNVVEMAIEGVRPAADAKRIRIAVDLDRANGLMRGDGDRLQQVAWNLLVNAVKFTPKDGLIQVRVRRVASDLELTVTDDGIGIPASFLPHVFETFRQVDSSMTRAHGGLGLGLSIAKHIVDLHGGVMKATSAGEGKGATFTVLLPISPLVSTTVGVSRVPATLEQAEDAALPVAQKLIRVLVIDDEPDARELLGYVFEASGIEFHEASNVAEALRALETFSPSVIISDIGMPEEDGYSLIRRVRTLGDDRKHIPAIALTAFARNDDRKRALVDGFNLHMAKPVEPAKLVNAVLELARSARPTSVK